MPCLAHSIAVYPFTGDLQLVATIICCLGACPILREVLQSHMESSIDRYLVEYAELLYSWGLHATRLEVLKHIPGYMDSAAEGNPCLWELHLHFPEAEAVPKDAMATRGLCGYCQLPVDGVHMLCMKCLHGGHASHMSAWFAEHTECPTGCGCICEMQLSSKR